MPRTAQITTKGPKRTASTPKPAQGTQRPRSTVSRAAVRAASIAGTTDKDIVAHYKGKLAPATIRSWRRNDPEWSLIFARLKPPEVGGRPRNIDKAKETAAQATTTALLEASLPAISSRNAIRAANEVDRALAKVEKRKTPLPITSWPEYKTAFSVLKMATGEDGAQGAQVQVNIWGNPGSSNAGIAPAFRDVTSRPAPRPAIVEG